MWSVSRETDKQRKMKTANGHDLSKWEPSMGPPHERVINGREIRLLLDSKDCLLAFDCEDYTNSNSAAKGRYYPSKSCIESIRRFWKDRLSIYSPSRSAECMKDTGISPPSVKSDIAYKGFMKILVAEFLYHWKVDYQWETAGYGKKLEISQEVMSILTARNGRSWVDSKVKGPTQKSAMTRKKTGEQGDKAEKDVETVPESVDVASTPAALQPRKRAAGTPKDCGGTAAGAAARKIRVSPEDQMVRDGKTRKKTGEQGDTAEKDVETVPESVDVASAPAASQPPKRAAGNPKDCGGTAAGAAARKTRVSPEDQMVRDGNRSKRGDESPSVNSSQDDRAPRQDPKVGKDSAGTQKSFEADPSATTSEKDGGGVPRSPSNFSPEKERLWATRIGPVVESFLKKNGTLFGEEASREREALQKEVAELKSRLLAKGNALIATEQIIFEDKSRIMVLAEDLKQQAKDAKLRDEEIASLKTRVGEMKGEQKRSQKRVDSLSLQLAERDQQLATLRDMLWNAEAERETLRKKQKRDDSLDHHLD